MNNGPGRNSNSEVLWLKTLDPVTSEGRTSGVNWMRRNVEPRAAANERASRVLPTPGTSSSNAWPRQSTAMSSQSRASSLPTTTDATASRIRKNTVSESASLSIAPDSAALDSANRLASHVSCLGPPATADRPRAGTLPGPGWAHPNQLTISPRPGTSAAVVVPSRGDTTHLRSETLRPGQRHTLGDALVVMIANTGGVAMASTDLCVAW